MSKSRIITLEGVEIELRYNEHLDAIDIISGRIGNIGSTDVINVNCSVAGSINTVHRDVIGDIAGKIDTIYGSVDGNVDTVVTVHGDIDGDVKVAGTVHGSIGEIKWQQK